MYPPANNPLWPQSGAGRPVARFYRTDWGTLPPQQEPGGGPAFPNREGFTCCALGPQDQSGGCAIQIQQGSEFSAQNLRVSPGAPLLLPPVNGPVLVIPDFAVNAQILTKPFSTAHTVDLLFYKCPPPFVPVRPIQHNDGVLSGTGNASKQPIFTQGRVAVTVQWFVSNAAAEACQFNIYGYMLTGTNSLMLRKIFGVTSPADQSNGIFTPFPGNAPPTPATGETMPARFDLLLLALEGTVTTSTITYSVRATDL